MITGMDFIALPARDLAALRTFYEETLGFPREALDGSPWTEFDLGPGPAISLIEAARMGMADDPVTTGVILIATHDLAGKLEKFKALGLAAPDATPFESPVCHGVAVRDSHGNALMLHCRKENPGVENSVDVVVLPSTDVKGLAAWYRDTLGLTEISLETDGWTEFLLPDGSALALGDPRPMGVSADPVKTGSIALCTPDLEVVFEQFKAIGLTSQDAIMETPVCHMAFVHDPAGNELILHRHKSEVTHGA